jgi:hypothetical protein
MPDDQVIDTLAQEHRRAESGAQEAAERIDALW